MIPIIAILLITTFTVIGIGFTAYSIYKWIKPDYCEWVLVDEWEHIYFTDCYVHTGDICNANFCPYCGSKIKVVEK